MSAPLHHHPFVRGFAFRLLVAMALTAAVAACGSDGRTLAEPGGEYPGPVDEAADGLVSGIETGASGLSLRSAQIQPGLELPPAYVCDAATAAPPLDWETVPAGTVEFAIVVSDNTDPPTYHWIAAGISANTLRLQPPQLPNGVVRPRNSGGGTGWFGPCTAEGTVRQIRFAIHALDRPTDLSDGAATADAVAAIQERTIESGAFTTTVTG